MSESKTQWVKVATLDDLEENALNPVKLGDKPLVLVRLADGIRAFDGKCPHKGAPMEEGVICRLPDGSQAMVCPWHKAMFSVETGRRLAPPALDPLDQYEAEARGNDVYVCPKPKQRPKPTPMRQSETVAIAGAGAAALAACVTLREVGFAGRIILISSEKEPPYDRTALSKFALASAPRDINIPPLRDDAWYKSRRIERCLGVIERFDYDARCFYLEGGEKVTAEHVLLATGSKARTLDIPGIELGGVFTLRDTDDAFSIAEAAGNHVAAVVIGSGFIGMEAAAALRKRGVGVTVISRADYPFEKQFGSDIAARMRSLHEAHGTAFLAKRNVVKIGGSDGQVEWVELDDGTKLKTSLVLVGVGASPALDFMTDFPRNNDNGGLDVDHRMSLGNDVFAAGDIASVPVGEHRYRVEHWRTAQFQGQIAARSMFGLPVEGLSTPWFWTQQYDQKLEWVGWPGQSFDEMKLDGDLESFKFLARLQHDGKTVGVVGSGRAKEMGCIAVNFNEA